MSVILSIYPYILQFTTYLLNVHISYSMTEPLSYLMMESLASQENQERSSLRFLFKLHFCKWFMLHMSSFWPHSASVMGWENNPEEEDLQPRQRSEKSKDRGGEDTFQVAGFCYYNSIIKAVLEVMTLVFKSGLSHRADRLWPWFCFYKYVLLLLVPIIWSTLFQYTPSGHFHVIRCYLGCGKTILALKKSLDWQKLISDFLSSFQFAKSYNLF